MASSFNSPASRRNPIMATINSDVSLINPLQKKKGDEGFKHKWTTNYNNSVFILGFFLGGGGGIRNLGGRGVIV